MYTAAGLYSLVNQVFNLLSNLHTELHQLSSPTTADGFLDDLLETSQSMESAVSNTAEFGQYVMRSWAGIYRSLGLH